MIMGGGGGSTFEAIRTSRSGSAFMFKNGFGKVKVYISDTGILAVKADKYQIADFYSNGAGLYSFFVEGKRAIYASGGVTPFTGAHLGVMAEAVNYEFGDLIKRLHVLAKPDISNSISSLALSDSYKQKTCYGVIAKDMSMIDYINITKDTPLGLPLEQISINDRMITINSVGEGLINVCGLGGNIENGDNLCASSMPGKAQCQGDDLLYNYTVAESHEAVVFDTPEQVKQIACTYKF